MDCLEFRRRLLTDAGNRDSAVRGHVRDCAACARWAADSIRFENLLRKAVDVEVPENLASRILLRHSFRHTWRDRPKRGAFALAASLVVAVLFGGLVMWFESRPTLANDVFRHIDDTSYALTSTTILDDSTVAGVFRWFGAEPTSELGDVSFANVCSFRDKRVAHFVLRDSRSPVTVIIMPAERLESPMHLGAGKRSGLLLPYAGGSMAIVAEPGTRLEDLAGRVRRAIRWPGSDPDSNSAPS